MYTLYIIGNGFDLLHNLPTSYSSFKEFLAENNSDLLHDLENHFDFHGERGYEWKDFENDLFNFDYSKFLEARNFIDIHDDNFKPKMVYGLEDEVSNDTDSLVNSIRNEFEGWIRSIKIDGVPPRIELHTTGLFISFNYTSTLERVYKIESKRILYIHGSVDRSEELVFGHCRNIEDAKFYDEKGKPHQHMFVDAEEYSMFPISALKKPVKEIIDRNKRWFRNLSQISVINIMGHSLSDVDLPYFQEIKKWAPEANWTIWGRSEELPEKYKNQLLKIGVKKSTIYYNRYQPICSGTLFEESK